MSVEWRFPRKANGTDNIEGNPIFVFAKRMTSAGKSFTIANC